MKDLLKNWGRPFLFPRTDTLDSFKSLASVGTE